MTLIEEIIEDIFVTFDGNSMWRNMILTYVRNNSAGREREIEQCINRIYNRIHRYYQRRGIL